MPTAQIELGEIFRCRSRQARRSQAESSTTRNYLFANEQLSGGTTKPELFENPAVAALQKVAILDKLNTKMGLQKELRNLIAVLINNDRIAHIHEVAAAYRAELQERQGIRQAEIVTARELGEQERATLLAGVGRLAGARIQASFKLDQSILGGTVVRIGSTVYDGSVKGRLERLREELIAG